MKFLGLLERFSFGIGVPILQPNFGLFSGEFAVATVDFSAVFSGSFPCFSFWQFFFCYFRAKMFIAVRGFLDQVRAPPDLSCGEFSGEFFFRSCSLRV